MSLKQRFEYRQKLVFTQNLQMSVRLLELPILDLVQAVNQELQNNPAMEENSQPTSPSLPIQEARDEFSSSAADKESLPLIRGFIDDEYSGFDRPIPDRKQTLSDTLNQQLRISCTSEEDIRIGLCIISHLDDNGYISSPLASIAAECGCSQTDIERILTLIQTLDPAGIGARSLSECLSLQLQRQGMENSLCFKLAKYHLEDLGAGNIKKLCRTLRCTQEEITCALEKIHTLEPKPGRLFSQEETSYIVPDITLEERDGQIFITTADENLPVLKVSSVYKGMLRSKKIDSATKDFIRQKIQNAQNFIHAIAERRKNIVRVVSAIAEVQKEAFLHGLERLNALTIKEIAQKTALHESTVSRIVNQKHIQTPHGTYLLKNFFSSGLKTSEGEDISSQSIKLSIKNLIDNEDKKHPLRDNQIADMIRQSENTPVARRTVAKYRHMLKIPSASQRRIHQSLLPNKLQQDTTTAA